MSKFSKFIQRQSLFALKISALTTFVVSSYFLVNYYQSKQDRWFAYLPADTVFAIKTNTHALDSPVASAKLRNLTQSLFSDADSNLKQLFHTTTEPVTLVALKVQQVLVPALVFDNSSKSLSQIPTALQIQVSNNQTLVSNISAFNQKPLNTQVPISQLNNHPANSFAYVYINPAQISQVYFFDKLLTANQKSMQSLLSNQDRIFFNLETQDNKLYFSNYTNTANISAFQPAISHSSLKSLNANHKLAYIAHTLDNILPKTALSILQKLSKNAGLHAQTLQNLRKSQITITKDTSQQWHLNFQSPTPISQAQIHSVIHLINNYFNPQDTKHILKTNQASQYNLAALTLSTDAPALHTSGTIYLESLNLYLHYQSHSNKSWKLVFSPYQDIQIQTSEAFRVHTPQALAKSQEFLSINLQTLEQLLHLDLNLPAFQAEVFSRDYRFGTHTLIVLE